jgi:hypothetical protein
VEVDDLSSLNGGRNLRGCALSDAQQSGGNQGFPHGVLLSTKQYAESGVDGTVKI